jgi:hypothetical protein
VRKEKWERRWWNGGRRREEGDEEWLTLSHFIPSPAFSAALGRMRLD